MIQDGVILVVLLTREGATSRGRPIIRQVEEGTTVPTVMWVWTQCVYICNMDDLHVYMYLYDSYTTLLYMYMYAYSYV